MALAPGAPESVERRLTGLRNGLLRLHKALLDSERARYDRDVERIRSTGQLFSLVLNDPFFAWLRELSELIAIIDEHLYGEERASSEAGEALRERALILLTPDEDGAGFRRRYFEAIQRDPDVVLAHAQAVRVLADLG